MTDSATANIVRFGVFELDAQSGELRRHGLKVRLPDQSFQILKLLLSRPGEVVTREELRQVLWTSDTFVAFDTGLNSAIRKLRDALDDSAVNPRFVETLPRRGYRFIGAVRLPGPDRTSPPEVITAPTKRFGTETVLMASTLLLLAAIAAVIFISGRRGFVWLGGGSTAEPIHSLVVLPFENLTGDASQEYFADSVTDALTTRLAQVSRLDVISGSSARLYKQARKPLSAIGDELDIDAVVDGTVTRSGSQVRITAQLIRVATDRHLWAQSYDGELGQILTLQERIAADIAAAAGRQAPPSASARDRRKVDPQAYEAYLAGMIAAGSLRYEGQRRAVEYFEAAVARQPDFAEAYAALAANQQQFLFGGPLSPHEVVPKAEAAARKALQIDETLAQPHRTLGQILSLYYWKWDEADKEYQRASELSTRSGDSPAAAGTSLIRKARFSEALAMAERERKLDPLSFPAQVNVGTAYRAAGQYDRALLEFRRALEMNPGNTRAHFQRGATYVAMGRLPDAIVDLEVAARSPQGRNWRLEAYLGYAYAAAGRTADARSVLKELESQRHKQYVSSFGIALIHDALGEKEPALAALERAHEDHAVEFAQMAQYPPFRSVASEPRFQAILRQIGLPHK